jgi:hypothetical protein
MARIRRGEDVSPDEIAAASARMEAEEREGSAPDPPQPSKKSETKPKPAAKPVAKEEPSEPVNEWLPEGITAPKKRSKGKKK